MENYTKRRKSSFLFSPVIEDFELVDNLSEMSDKNDDVNTDLESRSYYMPTSNSLSIFSRMSEISLQTLSTKYQYFFFCSFFLMIFLMGIVIGALMVKISGTGN